MNIIYFLKCCPFVIKLLKSPPLFYMNGMGHFYYRQTIDDAAGVIRNSAVCMEQLKKRALRLHHQYRACGTASAPLQQEHEWEAIWLTFNRICPLLGNIFNGIASDLEGRGICIDEQQALFLTAYAAGAIMIEGAQFLSDIGNKVPMSSEGEDNLAFNGHLFTPKTVQRSLNAPLHVWHLYHANRFYDRSTDFLNRLVNEIAELQPLFMIINRLHSQIRVSTRAYEAILLQVHSDQISDFASKSGVEQGIYAIQRAVTELAEPCA